MGRPVEMPAPAALGMKQLRRGRRSMGSNTQTTSTANRTRLIYMKQAKALTKWTKKRRGRGRLKWQLTSLPQRHKAG